MSIRMRFVFQEIFYVWWTPLLITVGYYLLVHNNFQINSLMSFIAHVVAFNIALISLIWRFSLNESERCMMLRKRE